VELPVQFEVDADRVQGGQVVVTLSDNSTSTGTFFVDSTERVNDSPERACDADAATRRSHHRTDVAGPASRHERGKQHA
jgi:hypothetical protein